MDSALDVLIVAAAGSASPTILRAMVMTVDHLAQMIDDPVEAAECYRAADALRSFAEGIGES